MQQYEVLLAPDAISDLISIYDYILDRSGLPDVALAYVQQFRSRCEQQTSFTRRGNKRDDIQPNLKVLPLHKQAVVAFEVDDENEVVTILNIFYGGRDYESLLGE